VISKQAYYLALLTNLLVHNVFYVSLLELYHPRKGKEVNLQKPLVIDKVVEYEVEEILDIRKRKSET